MSLTVEKCLQAWINSLRQMNAKADIVFFGDSLTYYGDFSLVFPDKVVCNLGLRGDTIQGMNDRVEQVNMLQPSLVFIMAGINDVSRIIQTEFKQRYERLIETIQKDLPDCKLVLQSLTPVNNSHFTISCSNEKIVSFNQLIAQIARSKNLNFLDLFSCYQIANELPKNLTIDGIHLTKESYYKWYDLLSDFTNYRAIV